MIRNNLVLLVDDDMTWLTAMSLYLGNMGYPVRVCNKAVHAIGYFRYTAFMLVVADLDMPGMDGAELLYAAKNLRRAQKVMVVTAGDRNPAQLRCLGAIDVLHKPFCQDELLGRIRYIAAEERRASGRVAARFPLRMENGREAVSVDISVDGLLLESRFRIANGSRLSLGIIGLPCASVTVSGTVVRSYISEDLFRAAVYFDRNNGRTLGKCFPMFS